ncbi:electron transfer flavoprotein subunit alpha/FixB family protein [Peptoniphilus sp.]|jgi:electron transfer flavoprotein alpha subunit|uniref:electron transfer flavoprotein subunit alpha/FixB family protein n=1 Tax=Peptoniphilus sp. TaxID=1971214 RepID=UPI003D8A582E
MKNGNIWVIAERNGDTLSNITIEIMSKAKELSKALDKKLSVVTIGYENDVIAKEAGVYGADRVIQVNDKLLEHYTTLPFTKVILNLIDKYDPALIMIPATVNGRDFAGRICAKNNTGLVADCHDIKLTDDKSDIKFIRPTFDGKLFSDVRISSERMIATVGKGAFVRQLRNEDNKYDIIIEESNLTEEDVKTTFVDFEKSDMDPLLESLLNSKVVVSGGMGLKSAENWHLVEELAEALGANVGATKPVADLGWCAKELQVGVTGAVVKPDVYIALGISGAIQHINGMKDSSVIIAVNNDPEAPIFKTAHYGIVADLFEFVPKLIEKIKAL